MSEQQGHVRQAGWRPTKNVGRCFVSDAEAGTNERVADGAHLLIGQLHDRLAHRAAVVALQPGLILPQVAMDEIGAGEARLDGDARLPRRIDAPVDLHRLVELALAQQPESFGHGAAPVLKITGPHPLHAEHLDRERRMRLERVREQHALAFDHLPELVVAADPGPAPPRI